MNTLAHITAIVALMWLADELYNARSEPILGFVAVGFALFFLVGSITAIDFDWNEFVGRKDS